MRYTSRADQRFRWIAGADTARDEHGAQAGEFGDSSGVLGERLHGGACGTPDAGDWIVRVQVVLAAGSTKERRGPHGAHRAAERVAERVRAALRDAPADAVRAGPLLAEPRRRGGLRVLYAKLVMGQGAMHEKVLLPDEPAGLAGGRSIIDLGQGPVLLRANEVRDGAIRSLCCVSPSTKETTLHHFRDPLLERLAGDETIDLVGVAVFGSPAAEVDKRFVAERLAALASSVGPDGVIVATEGFGNNHIDWAHAIAGIVRHGVPAVGVTWAADQGRLVVGNEDLVALVEANGSASGRETLRLGENCATPAVADRAVTMLRSFAAGVDVLPAPAAWDAGVIAANQALVDAEAGPASATGSAPRSPWPRSPRRCSRRSAFRSARRGSRSSAPPGRTSAATSRSPARATRRSVLSPPARRPATSRSASAATTTRT